MNYMQQVLLAKRPVSPLTSFDGRTRKVRARREQLKAQGGLR